jgi:hypothetical protein
MSDWAPGPGWWQASDGRWYPPESHPSVLPPPPPADGSHGWGPSGLNRRRTVLVSITGTLVAVLVIVVVVVTLIATGGSNRTVATFVPLRSSTSTRQLHDDAHQLTRRLESFNDRTDSVVVRGRTIVVLGATRLPVPPSTLVEPGTIQFRPALCGSAPYTASRTRARPGPVPGACSAPQYSFMAPNLIVNVATGNSNLDTIAPDPALAPYPTSSAADNDDNPAAPVLIPLDGGGGERYLVGPSELNGTVVAATQAAYQGSQWVVNVTLTDAGATAFDRLAQKYFHEIIAIDLDGRIISAPLTQPAQATYTSFAGRVQISGSFSQRAAQALAADLDSGPLTAPLRVRPS